MKKVLIIAYYYYHRENIGSNRTYGLYKYLPQFGWDVTLITNKISKINTSPNIIAISNNNPLPKIAQKVLSFTNLWSSPMSMGVSSKKTRKTNHKISRMQRIIKTVYNALSKVSICRSIADILFKWLKSFYYSKIYLAGWYHKPLHIGLKLLKSEKYDAIITIYAPASAHEIGSDLQKKTHLPWIADYRDLWSLNHFIHVSESKHNKMVKHELVTMSKAQVLTTVSESLVKQLIDQHHKKTYFIPNGFDPEDMKIKTGFRPKFTITFTGTLYLDKSLSVLFDTVHDLIEEGFVAENDFDIRFYGPRAQWLDDEIQRFAVSNCVKQFGVISKDDVKYMQRSSQLLLMAGPQNEDEDGVYGGKIFEYFGAMRPILAIGRESNNVIKQTLAETHSGKYCSSKMELKPILKDWITTYKEQGSVQYTGIESELNKYNYRAMAEKFANILDSISMNSSEVL